MKISKAMCMACCGRHSVPTGIHPKDFRSPVPWIVKDERRWRKGLIQCPNLFQEYSFGEKGIPPSCLFLSWQEEFAEGRCLPVMDEVEL
jgi:hypothetical protein